MHDRSQKSWSCEKVQCSVNCALRNTLKDFSLKILKLSSGISGGRDVISDDAAYLKLSFPIPIFLTIKLVRFTICNMLKLRLQQAFFPKCLSTFLIYYSEAKLTNCEPNKF